MLTHGGSVVLCVRGPALTCGLKGISSAGEVKPFVASIPKRRVIGLRFAVSLEQSILEAVRTLTAEKQQEVLSHTTRLRDEATKKKPFRSVKGLWADLGISLSADDIQENQREMWKDFPRQDI